MENQCLAEGVEVLYNGVPGTIAFVCEQYVTVCVARFESKVRDVCILVYPERYDRIKLAKESTK